MADRNAVSAAIAILETLLFTVLVPGTVAGYIPWAERSRGLTGDRR